MRSVVAFFYAFLMLCGFCRLDAVGKYGLYEPCDCCATRSTCCETYCYECSTDSDVCCLLDYVNPCHWTYGLRGEFLYWRAHQKDLDYAVDDLGANPVDGETHFLRSEYRPGFRVAVSATPPCADWQIRYEYTNLHTKEQGSVRAPDGGTLNLPLSHPAGLADAELADGSNRLLYDVGDVLAYGQCCLGDSVTLRPFGGFRFLRMDQRLHVEYSGAAIADGPQDIKFNSDFKALGLRGGSEVEFTLCGGLKTYAGVGGSALVARNKSHQQEYHRGTGAVVVDLRESERTTLFGWDVKVGILYEYLLCNSFSVETGIGYEFHQWLDTPEMRRFTNTTNTVTSTSSNGGNIGFHGGVARLQIGF